MYRCTLCYLISFVTTVFFLQWWQQPIYKPYIVLVGINLVVLFLYPKKYRTAISCNIGILIALIAVGITTHIQTPDLVDSFANGSKYKITGIISAEPDKRPMQTKYTIDTKTIQTMSGSIHTVQGRVLVTDKRMWPEFTYGQEVTVFGTLEKPGLIDEKFHYDNYLSRFGIYSVIYRGSITSKTQEGSSTFFGKLIETKTIFESQINSLYAEPYASFMAGLLTGSRRGIPDEVMQSFNTTGLTHIIAISGYNITIIISIISGLLFWLPLKWRCIPAVTAIIVFTLFVGSSAAVVRASIMGILGLIALQLGRQSHARISVLWTMHFMLLSNPKLLWYDAGFQLSFLAVIGLMECATILDRWCSKLPQVLGIREGFQMTMAAQLSAVPIIVLIFGRLSIIAPIANIIVAPAIPLAMLFGFLGTICSFVFYFPGQLLAYIGWICLEWIIVWAKLLSKIPYSSIDIPNVHISIIILYYILLTTWIYKTNTTTHIQKAS